MKFLRSSVVLLLLLPSLLFAQGMPTASLNGRVTSSDGAALPGVTVTVQSPNLQGSRTTVTTESGDYLFNYLPPGNYTVTFALEGLQGVRRTTVLSAARIERVDATLGPGTMSETITVSAETPLTAAVESTQISTNFRQDLIEELPVSRSLQAVTLLAPGVNDNGPDGNIMISGAMSFESLYLVNGAVVNENLRGQPQNLFIEDAVQETTVLTGAISAEYGHTTGGVVNAITKSGGNQLSGSFRSNLTNESWAERRPFTTEQADEINTVYEATFGGPILRDRLWYFAAGRLNEDDELRQTIATRRTGDIDAAPIAYENAFEERRLEGKLTGSITSRHTLVGSYMDVEQTENNYAFDSIMDLASLVPERRTPHSFLVANYTGTLPANLFAEAQYSRRNYSIIGSGSKFTDIVRGTLILDRSRGTRYNSPTFRRPRPEERNNQDYLLKLSHFLGTRRFGTHDLRAGYERYNEVRDVDNYQSGSDFRVSAPTTILRGNQIFPSFPTGTTTRIIWNPLFTPSTGADYTTDSFFVNDRIQLGPRWIFNIGARYDQNDAVDAAGNTIADDSNISPRVAAHFDVLGDGRFVVNGGYAQYVARLAEGAANDADAGGRTASFQWNYRGPSINGNVNAPTEQLIPTDRALQMLFEWFQAQGGTNLRPFRSVSIPGFDTRINGSLTSPNMKEYTVGFASRFGRRGYARVDLMHRDWDDFYSERIDTSTGRTDPDPGGTRFDRAFVENTDFFERTYEAVQTQFQYEVLNRVTLGGNYTWSRLVGNLVGETDEDGPVTGQVTRYPEYRQESWNYPMGYLPADQRHRARIWASYDLPTAFGEFNFSVLQSFDSGSAYSIDGSVNPSPYVTNPGYLTPPTSVTYYFGPRGGLRTDDITRTDFALNYKIKLARVELFLQPELLNIFGEEGVVSVNDEVLTNVDDNTLRAFNPFTETPVEGVHWRRGENFGRPTRESSFQTPRTFRVSLGLRF